MDVTLAAETALAGGRLTGVVEGRYLFGAPMRGRPARWTFSRGPVFSVPEAITDKFPAERWVFLDNETEQDRASETLQTNTQPLDVTASSGSSCRPPSTRESPTTMPSRRT